MCLYIYIFNTLDPPQRIDFKRFFKSNYEFFGVNYEFFGVNYEFFGVNYEFFGVNYEFLIDLS